MGRNMEHQKKNGVIGIRVSKKDIWGPFLWSVWYLWGQHHIDPTVLDFASLAFEFRLGVGFGV